MSPRRSLSFVALLPALAACNDGPEGPAPDPGPAVDCAPLDGSEGAELCARGGPICEAVYRDGRGCDALCAAAGLSCLRAYEDVDGLCAADYDHVSASWGIDESLSAGSRIDNFTVQYSISAEGLHRTRLFHGAYDADHGGHSMGSLFKPSRGDAEISVHHNLFAHNNNRNPAIGTCDRDQSMRADLRNNVVHGCPNTGCTSGASAGSRLNDVGNLLTWGPDSDARHLFRANRDSNVRLFARDNRRDLWPDGHFVWDVDAAGVLAGDFERAGERVVDGDRDGMPDAYERQAGTDPDRADHNGDVDGDGYTNLENDLHHMAAR